ncbi:MAG: tetratricopeptide repeat protein [Bacteroidota bacterium]
MKSSLRIIFFPLAIFAAISVMAQTPESELDKASDDDKIASGEYYFGQRLFRLSLMAWESLLKDYPDNARVNYMAAKCILHLHARKEEALAYLQKVEKNIGIDVKFKDKTPDILPIDAHFLLGQAFHHNENPDKAIEQYNLYLTKGKDVLSEQEKNEVKHWIGWAQNAKEQLANPNPDVQINNIGNKINSPSDEYSPVLSLDEKIMYFTSRRVREDKSNEKIIDNETGACYEDVYMSVKDENGNWSEPELINFTGHKADEHEATVSVSADGTIIYVYMDREGGGDIFVSDYHDGDRNFSLSNLKGDINSISWETHSTITPDGNVLFFTSNRPGGYGGLDIYRVIKLPNGEWSKAEALPPPINTEYDEDAPFIHPGGKILYFSSKNDNSMGEYDIFYSEILSQEPLKFSEPVSLGAPVNTVDNDMFFMTNAKGDRGYYSTTHSKGFGGQDIYYIDFKKPNVGSLAILKGYIKMVDGSQIPENLSITLNSGKLPEELFFRPRLTDGGFVMALEPCNEYTIEYFKEDSTLKKETFTVPCKSGYQEIYKELYIDTLYLALGTKEELAKTQEKEKIKDKVIENTNTTVTTITSPPVSFEQYFGYNENKTQAQKEYENFVAGIATKAKTGVVKIKIDASASTVPTSTFPNNRELAKTRGENFKKQLLEDLKKAGVAESQLKFEKVISGVNGPAYGNDYDTQQEKYRNYQYVKASAQ